MSKILSTPPLKTIKLADVIEYNLKPLNLKMMEEIEDKFGETWDKLVGNITTKVLRYLLYV